MKLPHPLAPRGHVTWRRPESRLGRARMNADQKANQFLRSFKTRESLGGRLHDVERGTLRQVSLGRAPNVAKHFWKPGNCVSTREFMTAGL